MPTQYLALLWGINAGGNNIIKMSDLRQTFEGLQYSGVKTFIQSGNVIFSAAQIMGGAQGLLVSLCLRWFVSPLSNTYTVSFGDGFCNRLNCLLTFGCAFNIIDNWLIIPIDGGFFHWGCFDFKVGGW